MDLRAELAELSLPEFGVPEAEPEIPAGTYLRRLDALRGKARDHGLGVVAVYGDREHSANVAWLTGYDPRFEETLLIVDAAGGGRKPMLLVGNEGAGYAGISPISGELDVVIFQSFSLPDQPRGSSRSLREILRGAGVGRGVGVGVVGWKGYTRADFLEPETTLEIPSFLADALRSLAWRGSVVNANGLLSNPSEGLRAVNDVDQLARFEFAASHTSQAVRDMIFGLRPGMTEFEAVRLMGLTGLPLSCHLMLSSGPRAAIGLPSPSGRVIERGDRFTVAYGVWGALNARAGFVAADEGDLPEGVRDYVERLVAPYFEAVAAWYGSLQIGATGGELWEAVHKRIGDPFFGVALNPGHLISLEEWLGSPVYEGSCVRLRSGMALQADVIPATGGPYFTTNVEDTVALADAELRGELRRRYPGAWRRVEARRMFMEEELGISLSEEVLPFSNIPAYLPPLLLSPRRAMRLRQ